MASDDKMRFSMDRQRGYSEPEESVELKEAKGDFGWPEAFTLVGSIVAILGFILGLIKW